MTPPEGSPPAIHEPEAAETRLRLACDLHDGIIQSLAAAALRLESARQLLEQDPVTAGELIEAVQELLVSEQRELRGVVATLAPVLAPGAVAPWPSVPPLRELEERMARHWNLLVDLRDELPAEELAPPLASELHRILHEALVNAARHGGATRAQVYLRRADGTLRLTVIDNGRGFPFSGSYDFARLNRSRLGPVSLKHRIGALGGQLEITSSKAGARLELLLPDPGGAP